MKLRVLQLAVATSLAFANTLSISRAQSGESPVAQGQPKLLSDADVGLDFHDAAQDRLRLLHLRSEDIKDELAHTGRVVRRKASEAGHAIADGTTDARITAAIKAKLAADRDLSALNVPANTSAGVVTFKGTVSSPEHISKAMLLAMETAGVREVISTLSIQPGKRLLTDAEVGLAGTFSPKLSQVFSCLPGVTIRLPAGWKQIDRQTLDASASELIEGVPNAHLEKQTLVAGFQPESDQPGIIFPRIIVIANKVGRVSYQELKELVASLKQELQRGADDAVKGNPWKAAIKVGDVSYDDQRQCIRFLGVASAGGPETIRAIQTIFPTEFGLVTFQFSSTGQDYDRYAPLFSKIIDGIETSTTARAQSPTTGASYGAGEDLLSSVILATLVGGVILVVVWQLWLYVAPASGKRSRANIELPSVIQAAPAEEVPPVTEGAPPVIPDATTQGSETTTTHGYFILQNDEAEGPYSIEELRSLWGAGSITRETFYCEEGYDEWLRLELVADQLQLESAEQTSVKD